MERHGVFAHLRVFRGGQRGLEIVEVPEARQFREHVVRCDDDVDLLIADHRLQFRQTVFVHVEIVVDDHVFAEFLRIVVLEFVGLAHRRRSAHRRRIQCGTRYRADEAHDDEGAERDHDDGGEQRHQEVRAGIRGLVFRGNLHEDLDLRFPLVLRRRRQRVDCFALLGRELRLLAFHSSAY